MSRLLERTEEGKVNWNNPDSILLHSFFRISKMNTFIFDRQIVMLAQFDGWLLNHLPEKVIAKNLIFGCLELLVCIVSSIENGNFYNYMK
jgi:hypothetical protein